MTEVFIAVIFERNRHCEKAFSADEAILQRSLLVCALRLLHNDDLSVESVNGSEVEGEQKI